MARVLIVGASERRLHLAVVLVTAGHAVRVVVDPNAEGRARAHARAYARAAIENEKAPNAHAPTIDPATAPPHGEIEWSVGDAQRLGTLRAALEQVSIACWLFGSHVGSDADMRALHGTLLETFIRQITDSSVRGLIYETADDAPADVLDQGRGIVSEMTANSAIPLAVIAASRTDEHRWLDEAGAAIAALLGPPVP
jgi:hypothetical protein